MNLWKKITGSINKHETAYIFFYALMLVGIFFLCQESIGLNLADEGFLWYGASRTAHGAIPIKDFQGYDPGRYYWIAAWFWLSGQQGIMALRMSVALFQTIGLFLGLLAAKRVVTNWWQLLLVGLLLVSWMLPRHKLFESSLTMGAVCIAVRLIERFSFKNIFLAGSFVGLSAFIGRNHGLYTFLAFLLLLVFLRIKLGQGPLLKQSSAYLAGVIIGYAPTLIMMTIIPGFFSSFMNLMVFFVKQKATNLPLPVPWPWTIHYSHMGLWNGASSLTLGMIFLLLPPYYLFAATSAILTNRTALTRRSLFLASTFVGVFYMHHAFSRAALWHLAQSIHPALLNALALSHSCSRNHRRICVGTMGALLSVATIFVAIIPNNLLLNRLRFKDQYIRYDIEGDHLWINKAQGAYLDYVKQLITRHVGSNEWLLIAPLQPGLYRFLNRVSPIQETYLLFPETEKRQIEIIMELDEKHVNWAILSDVPVDGRDELRFRNTHPLVWQYIKEKFEPVESSGLPTNQQFLHRKGSCNES